MFRTPLHTRFYCLLLFLCTLLFLVTSQHSAEAATWYLKPGGTGAGTSWTEAAGNIQATIHSAVSEDEIWAASGTYHEAISMATGIALYGGFTGTETTRDQRDWTANKTILNATGFNSSVVTVSHVQGTLLDGFTITGGFWYPSNSGEGGGGVSFSSVTSATMNNCTITRNSASIGGGVACNDAHPTLVNCLITSNKAYTGGGVSSYDSAPTLTNCTVSGNTSGQGGGLSSENSSSLTLSSCTISGNTANDGGGVYCHNASLTMTNCLISSNVASTYGGGVCMYRIGFGLYTQNLTNCTLAGNSAPEGGGLYIYRHSPTVTNCILWNTGDEVSLVHSGVPVVSYSCIEDGYSGTGNISDTPLFMDATNGDYHLQAGSLCATAGIGPALNSNVPSYDLDGVPRFGDFCTIGAYEIPHLALTPTPTLADTPTATDIPTLIATPSPTETTQPNYDVWPETGDGEVDSRDLLQLMSDQENLGGILFDFSCYWQRTLVK